MRTLIVGAITVAAAFGCVVWLSRIFESRLLDPVFMTGWVLVAAMALQLLLRVKKRLPGLIPGTLLDWTWRHAATGLFIVLVFALHTDFSLPETALEWVLFGLFVAVTGSGLLGLYLVNVIPLRLEHESDRETFEEMPAVRARIAQSAARLAAQSLEQTGSRAVVDLYAERLHTFFDRPRHAFAHLQGSRRPLKRLVFEIEAAESDAGTGLDGPLEEMKRLVQSKYALDGRHAYELALRAWLFVHLPATYAMIVLTVVHGCIAYAFTSGGHVDAPEPQPAIERAQ